MWKTWGEPMLLRPSYNILSMKQLIQSNALMVDVMLDIISSTLLDSRITLPLYTISMIARGFSRNAIVLSTARYTSRVLLIFASIALVRLANEYLNRRIGQTSAPDTFSWSREIVVVTGGSDGIGKFITLRLANKRSKIAVLDIQPLQYRAPDNVAYIYCDLANSHSIESAFKKVKKLFGPPTVLVNNAGIVRRQSIAHNVPHNVELTFRINTLAHYHTGRLVLPEMIKRNHGMIVTVSSVAGYVTAPLMVDYCASKAAAVSFHEGLLAEIPTIYAAPCLRSILVCPSHTRTALFRGFAESSNIAASPLTPEYVAQRITDAMFSATSQVVYLPTTMASVSTLLRTFPFWLQTIIRSHLAFVMRHWNGREVVQSS